MPMARNAEWQGFPFQLRFLLARYPVVLPQVLRIVYRTLAIHLIKKDEYTHQTTRTGAIMLIQRFGSALNLNIHFQRNSLVCLLPKSLQRLIHYVVKVLGWTCRARAAILLCPVSHVLNG